ncbi:MAG: hypothetical protein ABL952_15645 [Pyrinomonadaceae bacterium]
MFHRNSDMLGVLENSRIVTLRGSSTVNRIFNSSAFPIQNWIKNALAIAGFAVVGTPRYTWNSWFNDNSINIEIELEVYNIHTSEDARINAINALEAYTANYGLNKVFYNTTLSVAYDAYVAPTSIINPPSQFNNSNQNDPDSGGGDGSGFLDQLGLGAGLGAGAAVPFAILGGLILGYIVLKR